MSPTGAMLLPGLSVKQKAKRVIKGEGKSPLTGLYKSKVDENSELDCTSFPLCRFFHRFLSRGKPAQWANMWHCSKLHKSSVYKCLLSTFYVSDKLKANFMFHKPLLENGICAGNEFLPIASHPPWRVPAKGRKKHSEENAMKVPSAL